MCEPTLISMARKETKNQKSNPSSVRYCTVTLHYTTRFQVDNKRISTDDVFVGYGARTSQDLNLKPVLPLNRWEVEPSNSKEIVYFASVHITMWDNLRINIDFSKVGSIISIQDITLVSDRSDNFKNIALDDPELDIKIICERYLSMSRFQIWKQNKKYWLWYRDIATAIILHLSFMVMDDVYCKQISNHIKLKLWYVLHCMKILF